MNQGDADDRAGPQRPGTFGPFQALTALTDVQRLGLDFDRYMTVHAPVPDRPLTRADLMGAVQNAAPQR